MHFVVSWDIKAEGDAWKQANSLMKECLSGFSWVKPLTTLYIVRVKRQSSYDEIKEALKEVARESEVSIHFVVTPVMHGGRYDGWLPKRLWPKLRERAQEDE